MTSLDSDGALPTRAAPTRRQLRGDLVLAAVVLVGAILSAVLSAMTGIYGDEQAPLAYALVYAFVLSVPLAFRRRWPACVAVIVSLAYFAAVTLRVPEIYVGNIAMFIAIYTVGAWSTDRRRALIVRIAIIVGMFGWLLVVMYRDVSAEAADADVIAGALSPFVAYVLINIMINVLYFGGAYYFGEREWVAAVQRSALELRTAELERERETTAAQAVALDRVRIARELHDVVAHHVSVMGVQAGAARAVLERDPEAARSALAAIEQSAREAIGELRQLLETLRSPGGDLGSDAAADATAAPSTLGFAALPALVEASASAGLPTTFQVVGDPLAVSPVVQVNLYRIAQESLTNARRHAGPGATADVRLRYDESADGAHVELEVVSVGRPVIGVRPGLGLLGMRERAHASGGSLEAGPRDRGGFRVRVRVPLEAAALASESAPAAR